MKDADSVIQCLQSESGARDVTGEYKVTAARVLRELQKTLGHDLEDKDVFMFVHGTAECRLQPGSESSGKCGLRSEEARRKAEAEFERGGGDLSESLELVNRAVMEAPTDKGAMQQLALALFLRSRILLGMGQHQLALRDAGLAQIKGGFPETSLFSLYSHQAKCHEAIKCAFDAQKCYNRAISALDKSDLDQSAKDAEKLSIQEALNSLNRNKTGNARARNTPGAKNEDALNIHRPHPKYPALSHLVTVGYSQEKGRHALARYEIKPGTVLGMEEAGVSVLQADNWRSRCLHCLDSVLAGLPCIKCSEVVFCSPECRLEAMSGYHKYECRNMHLLLSGPNFLALRAITQYPLKYFLQNRVKKFEQYDDSSGTELEGSKRYNSNDMKNLFNLSTKSADIEKKMERFMVGAYLLRILQSMNYFEGEKKNEASLTEEEVYIGMLLSHFVGVAETNSHLICKSPLSSHIFKDLSEIVTKKFQPDSIGFGINATLAFFNHSCNPNTIKIQKGRKTFLIASELIRKGEDIFDNYGTLFYTSDKPQRLQTLGFPCSCGPCEGDWPQYRDLSDGIGGQRPGTVEATRTQLERGRAANTLMQRIGGELGAGNLGRVLRLAAEYRAALEKLVTQPHRFYYNCYMIMFYCYWIKYGNI